MDELLSGCHTFSQPIHKKVHFIHPKKATHFTWLIKFPKSQNTKHSSILHFLSMLWLLIFISSLFFHTSTFEFVHFNKLNLYAYTSYLNIYFTANRHRQKRYIWLSNKFDNNLSKIMCEKRNRYRIIVAYWHGCRLNYNILGEQFNLSKVSMRAHWALIFKATMALSIIYSQPSIR